MLANIVDGLVEESQSSSCLLIHYCGNGCPLWSTTAGAAERIVAGCYAGNVQAGQDAVENGRIVGNVGHALVLSTVKPVRAFLIWWLPK